MFFLRDFIETREQALDTAALQAISHAAQSSPYLQANVLNQRFATTEGFSVIFRRPDQLRAQFGELMAFMHLIDADKTNLYYLNVLAIREAGKVDRHVDHSIRGYDPQLPMPWRVSVLYLAVPPAMQGGELLIYDRHDAVSRVIAPATGLLVHFSGHSKHAVGAIGHSDGVRLSLVCEQYRLKSRHLKSVPEFAIKSMAPFAAFLGQQL